ncbi:MAG TPA: LuxR C-terminal-related transcriptional regulator, partial [Candidatus Limnocylindrales bacterium]|nr:LuxR C-terminal-related transcriptional regulator [Candidatus Limnocylindrales bacterium]
RQVPPTELRRLHARAGEFGAALEGHSEIHASVHFERAGLREEAFRAALTGADAASRISARQESFELYRRAIENMPDDLPVLEQAELYAMFSNAAAAIEHNAESIAAADEARTRYLEAGRPVEAADMHLQIASMPYREARPVRDVVRDLDVVLAEIEALPEGRDSAVLRAAAYDMKAFLELDGSMVDEAIVDSNRALELAERIGDRETALDATLTAARIDIRSGRLEQGFQRGFSAAREARDAGYESVGVTAFRNLAISAVRVLDYRTAELALGEGLRYADAIEQSHCRQQMATATALMSWATGRWDEAVETARQELVERGCRRGELSAIDVLGVVAMSRGEMGEARRWYDELLDAGEAMQEVSVLLPALWGLAEADLIAGDPNSAADRTSKALEIAIRSGDGALLIPLVVTGVRARLAIHRPDEAERWLARARDQLAGWTPVADAALAHAAGLVLLATGSMTAARESLQAAVRGWDDLGRVWETSWARLDLAQCLMRSSRYGEAANLLATVRETAESLGSGPLLGRADDLSRVARGRGTMEEPWRPLTAREFEVARLIAEGLTNGEIAQRLDIAPKTASAHVEHILAKLGVMRRAEIAAWTATVLRPEGRNGDGSVATGTSQRPPERRAAAVR